MFKNTIKLLSLLLLLIFSFIYTDKVFDEARKNDPLMKKVMNYKKKTDGNVIEPIIRDDEIILGMSGLVVDAELSYKKMKTDDKFNKKNVVYKKKLPDNSITKDNKYYITKGNGKNKKVSIILKVSYKTNTNTIKKILASSNYNLTFFIDNNFINDNLDFVFSVINNGYEVYNYGLNGVYDKNSLSKYNKLIESMSLKKAVYCLNEEKNKESKNVCDLKKMYSIKPNIIDPDLSSLKRKISSGSIVSYDLDYFSLNDLLLSFKTITSRGYEIESLSTLLTE